VATKPSDDASTRRDRYYGRLADQQLTPLWVFFHDWFTREPRVRSRAHVWSYRQLRELILESAAIIDPEEAERRVLALENPGLAGKHLATESLYAGLQLIMPGEVAPCHRHSPAALRFVLEASGAYTAVNGERAYMAPGDFIVTPSWTWHEHGHDGSGPTVWLDVLDVAMAHLFNATFTELHPDRQLAGSGRSESSSRPPLDSLYRFGMNLRPVDYRRGDAASPVFHYPYSRARETLTHLERHTSWDPWHGLKMEYIDPTTGGPAIPTISTYLQLLPAGFETKPYRSTAGTIFCVVEGRGTLDVDDGESSTRLPFEPWDICVVPSWKPHTLHADSEAVVFSASDAAAQRKLGLYREAREG
jgi:gentisate 1,2-dioxygenase